MVKCNWLRLFIVIALGGISVPTVAGDRVIGRSGNWQIVRTDSGCYIMLTGGNNGRTLIIAERHNGIGSIMFFDPAYTVSLNESHAYKVVIGGDKPILTNSVGRNFRGTPGIDFPMTNEQATNIVGRNVSVFRDDREVFGVSFDVSDMDAIDQLNRCLVDKADPFEQ